MAQLKSFLNRYRLIFYSKVLLLFVTLLLFCSDIFAQGPGGDPGDDPDLIPVDGGLGFLLAAGVGYGVKKVRERRKVDR